MTDLVCLSIVDSNGVLIELGDLMNARDFLIAGESPQEIAAFLRKCEYIQVVDGMEESTDAQGQPCRKTTLKTGKFVVNERVFLDRFTAWYTLKRNGKDWFADNKPTSAAWVKQRIQAALLPFGIHQKDMTSLYQLLMIHCAAFDAVSESLTIVTATDFNNTMYARPPFIVEGFLCAGLTLLAAPPKTGKSFLALDLACCVAEGKPFWGFDTVQGDVLYCDLEGTEWRTQDRFPAVGRKSKQDCPASLVVAYKAAPVDAGLIGQLDGWIASVKNPRLIILDTLAHVKGRVARGEDAYTADTRFMKPLHDLAVDKGVAILAITHTRKQTGLPWTIRLTRSLVARHNTAIPTPVGLSEASATTIKSNLRPSGETLNRLVLKLNGQRVVVGFSTERLRTSRNATNATNTSTTPSLPLSNNSCRIAAAAGYVRHNNSSMRPRP